MLPTPTRIDLGPLTLEVARAGTGPAVVLLHGWPHTWRIWSKVIGPLAAGHTVIAPDLRGFGGSDRPAAGYDAATVADDVLALLDKLELPSAGIVALDASVPAAFLFALTHADRVSRLVLMESLLMPLPGAEDFLTAGPPWWFGFHAVPGLAETVLLGHEDAYVDWFLRAGTRQPFDVRIRNAIAPAFRGREGLRGGFEYYRAMPSSASQVAAATQDARLTVPTLAIGGDTVGDALHRQLMTVANELVGHLVPHSGHIVPVDAPDALLDLLLPFLD